VNQRTNYREPAYIFFRFTVNQRTNYREPAYIFLCKSLNDKGLFWTIFKHMFIKHITTTRDVAFF
jgi:hypothetical protein